MSLSDDVTAQYLDQPVEVEDASALDQCFDWAFLAVDKMGIPRTTIRHGAARQIWENPTSNTRDYFDLVPNTPDYVAPPNAIAVFSTAVGPYGHVSWVISGSDRNNLQSSDQNWNGIQRIKRVTHTNYFGVEGFLVPKAPPAPPASTVDKPTADNEGVVNGAQLRGHTEPNTTSATQWYFDDNEHITLIARTTGENVTSGPYGTTNVWYLAHGNDQNAANAGYPQVWVSDSYVRTKATPANVPDYVPASTPTDTPTSPYSTKPTSGLWFVDISAFQGDIDFAALKATGVEGVIMRVGHVGVSYGGIQPNNTDPKFADNQAQARANGFLIGYYWYGFPSLPATQEAGQFVAGIGKMQKGETLWLDLEEIADGVDTATWVGQFMAEVEKLANRACHLYSYLDYVQNKVNLNGVLTGTRKLWLANYNDNPGQGLVNRLAVPIAHQYTSHGKLQGVSGNIDLDDFLMTVDEYTALANDLEAPNPTPEPDKPDGGATDETGNVLQNLLKSLLTLVTWILKKIGAK